MFNLLDKEKRTTSTTIINKETTLFPPPKLNQTEALQYTPDQQEQNNFIQTTQNVRTWEMAKNMSCSKIHG